AHLGKGGMSRVFEATHLLTGRRVAIKCLLRPDADSVDPRRLLLEARALARIEHPHLVQVFDVGFHERQPYLVMERLHGRSLSDQLERHGTYPALEAARLLDPVLDATHRLHAAGVVHRDVKPSNLFVVEDGIRPAHLKVLDFGVASLVPEPGGDLESWKLTASGAAVGTPFYMAPEQLGRHSADARTDVFALGAVLYEMITGERAFPARDLAELIVSMVSEDGPARLARLSRRVPELGAILARALAQEPAARFQSADEFRHALHGARGAAAEAEHARPAAELGGTLQANTAETSAGNAGAPAGAVLAPAPAGVSVGFVPTPTPSARGSARPRAGVVFAIAAVVGFALLAGPRTCSTVTPVDGAHAEPATVAPSSLEAAEPGGTAVAITPRASETTRHLQPSTRSDPKPEPLPEAERHAPPVRPQGGELKDEAAREKPAHSMPIKENEF
ncbi:MAG: hypothetical protein RL033_3296, partial [Pseudomonadota bacterium]